MEEIASCGATSSAAMPTSADESIPPVRLRPEVEDPYDQNLDAYLRQLFFEEGPENNMPFVGMEFSTCEEACDFYNNYAKRVGFSVRKNTFTTSKKQNTVSSGRLVCHKEGVGVRQQNQKLPIGDSNRPKTPEKSKGMTRTSCLASFRVKLVNGIWQVSVFIEEHNHPLITSPSKKRNLRSHKNLSSEEKDIIRALSEQNVGSSQILEFMAAKSGGKGSLTYKKQDVKNLISAETRKLIGFDVDAALMYF